MSVHSDVVGWDGSRRRTVDSGPDGDDRLLVVWEDARVVAGEPARLCVLAVADTRTDAFAWSSLAARLAGPPRWGPGPPPTAGFHEPPAARGVGPDGAPSWSQAFRVVAVAGTRGDARRDAELLAAATTLAGRVHVAVGHGQGARQVQLSATETACRVLVDGGVPLGPDADDQALGRSWTTHPPEALVTPEVTRVRYANRDLDTFTRQYPGTLWMRVPDTDHRTLVTGERGAMALAAAIGRAARDHLHAP